MNVFLDDVWLILTPFLPIDSANDEYKYQNKVPFHHIFTIKLYDWIFE